jgi:hypothetical protein
MDPSLAPIEAGAAQGPARPFAVLRHQCFGLDADPAEEPQAALGDDAAFLGEFSMAGSNQGVGQRDTELAGQMVVANARRAQGFIPWTGDQPLVRRLIDRCHLHDRFHHAGDGGRGELIVAVTSLLHDADQVGGGQTGEVTACGLRRHTGDRGELRGGQRPTAQQGMQHAGPRRITSQGRNGGEFPMRGHVSLLWRSSMMPRLVRRCFGLGRSVARGLRERGRSGRPEHAAW